MHEQILERLGDFGDSIRYCALEQEGRVQTWLRSGISGSSSESDHYEELLVNPAVLTLLGNRGRIDCGGLQYVLVRYGDFWQFVRPLRKGHVSIAIEPSALEVSLLEALCAATQLDG
jgi:hypothetical protein